MIRQLRGLEKVCRAMGRMKCGSVMMVWDYEKDEAVKQSEMPQGSERWVASERARFTLLRDASL